MWRTVLAPILGPAIAAGQAEAERAVGHCKLRRRRQTAPLEIKQKVAPGFGAFAHAIGKADQLFLALGRRADDHKNALRLTRPPRHRATNSDLFALHANTTE
jgi:hypothetical protein